MDVAPADDAAGEEADEVGGSVVECVAEVLLGLGQGRGFEEGEVFTLAGDGVGGFAEGGEVGGCDGAGFRRRGAACIQGKVKVWRSSIGLNVRP